ncbi:MAG: hypothetical protein WD768_16450 [Phycisphaeraceae bacterium]
MGLFGFGKKKGDSGDGGKSTANGAGGDNGKSTATASGGFTPDPRKARAWFDRAHQVADTNFDYAIDAFIKGLKFEPNNIKEWETLYEVGMRRLVSGGKPAGTLESMKSGGKTVIEKLAHAAKLWAMDPRNAARAMTVFERIADMYVAADETDLGEIGLWVGEKTMELNSGKKASKAVLVKAIALFKDMHLYSQGVEACRRALAITPDDANLIQEIRDMEALKTMVDSGMRGKEGDAMKGVKNLDEQRALDEEDQSRHDEAGHERLIARARKAFEVKPDDLDLLLKFVRTLEGKASDESEEEAMKVLKDAYDRTGQYRFKMDVGNVRIRQFNRYARMYRDALKDNPGDETLKKGLEKVKQEQLVFELKEFEERTREYPTEMKLRYELGKRLVMVRRFEDAVAMFQDAQANQSIRARCKEALGVCYIHMDWIDAAITTLKEGLEVYQGPQDDDLPMTMRYLLMDALERNAKKLKSVENAEEALKVASMLLQTNIRYRDIRERVNALNALIKELQDGGEAAA